MSALELYVLGPISLSGVGGLEYQALLARRKRFALLVYLALTTHKGFCSRDTLLPLFWPEMDQPHARGALRQAIHVLRVVLGPETVLAAGDDEVRLATSGISCDAVQFLNAAAAGDFELALCTYRGDLLAGFFLPNEPMFERWLEDERSRLRGIAAQTALTAACTEEAACHLGLAASWARRALTLNPYSEEVLRHFIRIHDSAGDRVQAVRTYDEFAARVQREWAVLPSVQTRALVTSVRAH